MCLAIPGQIVEILGDHPIFRQGKVDFGGVMKNISLACTPEAKVGEYVLVHVGMAISVVDEEEAQKTLQYLREIEELTELEDDGP